MRGIKVLLIISVLMLAACKKKEGSQDMVTGLEPTISLEDTNDTVGNIDETVDEVTEDSDIIEDTDVTIIPAEENNNDTIEELPEDTEETDILTREELRKIWDAKKAKEAANAKLTVTPIPTTKPTAGSSKATPKPTQKPSKENTSKSSNTSKPKATPKPTPTPKVENSKYASVNLEGLEVIVTVKVNSLKKGKEAEKLVADYIDSNGDGFENIRNKGYELVVANITVTLPEEMAGYTLDCIPDIRIRDAKGNLIKGESVAVYIVKLKKYNNKGLTKTYDVIFELPEGTNSYMIQFGTPNKNNYNHLVK